MELSPLRLSWIITNREGLNIQLYQEKKPNDQTPVTKAVLLCHGLQGKYELEYCTGLEARTEGPREVVRDCPTSFALQLNKQEGLAVFGIDHQGHGRSDSWQNSRTNVNKFDNYADDVCDVLRNIAERIGQHVPIVLVGISLGGAICIRAAQLLGATETCIVNLQGVVLLAPAISIEHLKAKTLNRIFLPFINVLSSCFPKLRMATVETHPVYPQIRDWMEKDELCETGKIPARLAAEAVTICDTVMKDYASIGRNNPNLKISFIHCQMDNFVDPCGSKNLFSLINLKNKELHLLPESTGMWHFLTIEPGHDQYVLPHIVSVIDSITPGSITTYSAVRRELPVEQTAASESVVDPLTIMGKSAQI